MRSKFFSSKPGAFSMLLLVTLIWGTTFPIQKMILPGVSPFVLNAARFGIAGLFSFLLQPRQEFKKGAILGLVMGVAYLTQTWGLSLTASSKSAFITSLYIVLVPLFAFLLERERLAFWQKLGFPVALLGSFWMAGGMKGFNFGDLLTVFCAITFAVHVVLVTRFSRNTRETALLGYQFLFAALFNALFGLGDSWSFSLASAGVMVYMAIFPSVIALFLQLKFQKVLGSNASALVMSGEPVFAFLFSAWLLGEWLTGMQFAGAGLLLLAVFFASFSQVPRKRRLSTDHS